MYLTTRPARHHDNYFELFNGLLNPKQLEGLRLLVAEFPQQPFNQTEDRRSSVRAAEYPASTVMRTVTPTGRRTSLVISGRRSSGIALTTPSLPRVNIQRIFGSHEL